MAAELGVDEIPNAGEDVLERVGKSAEMQSGFCDGDRGGQCPLRWR
ncbi:hypothetical protein HD600_002093 [Microbacterium ginsengiterrae]|uniref:Uncharacterized protein n=1 Tax=Microbacterium ginsengiterrae TaxID=546115 RepID=A0A7W9CDS3_9MICO|nr:hypothetical protein [Microbacterium ginsengiterrae]